MLHIQIVYQKDISYFYEFLVIAIIKCQAVTYCVLPATSTTSTFQLCRIIFSFICCLSSHYSHLE